MQSSGTSQSGAVFRMTVDTSRDHHVSHATPMASWQESAPEGQLAIDVCQDETDMIVVSTLAGAVADSLEVYVHNDLLTIRGERYSPLVGVGVEYHHEECFWGKFSRTVVMPVDVKGDLAHAEYKNGVLVVRIPKVSVHRKVPITIVDE